ncbi:MAG TPA: hypothetical protein VE572_02915 [Nitrososphaeraceae archaeon]|nr:hypothetical protein [Nitrososphaeraceae archaeon]
MLAQRHDNSNKRILVLTISVAVAVIIVDTSIVKVSDLIAWRFVHDWKNIILFIAMSSAYAICYYFVLEFIKGRGEKELGYARGKMRLSAATFRKIVSIIQYVITAILVLVILQIVFYSQYSSTAITAVMAISYATAIVMMGLLAYLFFIWFNQNRKSGNGFTVFLYGISSAALLLNTIIGFALLYTLSRYKPAIVGPRATSYSVVISSPIDSTLNTLYLATSILGFILMWSATAILLRSYSQRIGKAKYWFVVSIPLVYFISQFLTLFSSQLTSVIALSPVLFTLLFVFSKPVGGILFGTAFYSVGRSGTASSPRGNFVRDYMTLAAYGVVLFFVSSQSTVAQIPYPPFGVIATSFVGLSAYMMFLGLYSSAISVSQDIKLRQSIRRSAIQEVKFLESIGTAQMEQELQKRVLTIAKKNSDNMTEETGVQPSLSEEDMKQYLEEVLKEIKVRKT